MTEPLPLPGVGPDLDADLSRWAADQVWDALVATFGGSPGDMPVGALARLAWLDGFSDRWDVRRGQLERDQTTELTLSAEQGRATMAAVMPGAFADTVQRSAGACLVAGVLVGVGTQLGSGCTSGHGICGIGRLSKRSIFATVVFIVSGAVAVLAVRHLFGGVV